MAIIKHLPSLIRRAACCSTLAVASLLALPAFAAIPVRWTVDTFRVKPLVYDCYHGETLDLAADMTAYGEPLNLAGKTAHLFWQTNGMASVYWQTNATVRVSSAATNVLAAVFSGAFDPGASEVQGFIGVDGENYRAAFTLRFRPSPGFVPSALPLPTAVIDCATVSFTHPEASPFLQRGEIPATDLSPATNYANAVALAATNYTDACCRTLAAAQTNYTRTATNDLAATLRGEIAAHAPGNYVAVSNAAMTAVQPAALDSYATWEWVATPSSTFAGTAAKNLPATYSEGFGWSFTDDNPLTIDGSLSILGDNYWLWISGGWGNLQAGSAWQTLPEYITERTSDFLSTSWAEEPGSYFSGTASAAIGADFSTVAQKVAREVTSPDTECIYYASNDRWAAKDSGGNDHTFAYVSELPTWVEKAKELQFLENGPRLTFDSDAERWISIWQGRNTFAYTSEIPSTANFVDKTVAETNSVYSTNLLAVAERTTASKIADQMALNYAAEDLPAATNGTAKTALKRDIPTVEYEYALRTEAAPASVTCVSGEIVTATGINGTLNIVFPAEVANKSADFLVRVVTTGASQLGTLTISGGGTVTPEWLCDALTTTGKIAANKTTIICFSRVAANTYIINALEVK